MGLLPTGVRIYLLRIILLILAHVFSIEGKYCKISSSTLKPLVDISLYTILQL